MFSFKECNFHGDVPMPPTASPPRKYADLELRKGRSARGYKEYEYVGTKAPSWEELETLNNLFLENARDLHLNGGGICNIKGAPVAPGAHNCNGITFNFPDRPAFREFLKRPISPSLEGISLRMIISSEFRLG
jgi:hypothetical protein